MSTQTIVLSAEIPFALKPFGETSWSAPQCDACLRHWNVYNGCLCAAQASCYYSAGIESSCGYRALLERIVVVLPWRRETADDWKGGTPARQAQSLTCLRQYSAFGQVMATVGYIYTLRGRLASIQRSLQWI